MQYHWASAARLTERNQKTFSGGGILAKIIHLSRDANGGFSSKETNGDIINYVLDAVPSGVPFRVYNGDACQENDITDDIGKLQSAERVTVVEGAGSAGFKLIGKILNPIFSLLGLGAPTASTPNTQANSPNNSLSDRTNKARPYERTYDICGTVMNIPGILMSAYRKFDSGGREYEYCYYDVCRGSAHTPTDGTFDGDTLGSEISGSSFAYYAPYTSPNNGSPYLLIGNPIDDGLYISVSSSLITGEELKAPNELTVNVGDVATASVSGTQGTIIDPTGNAEFDTYIDAGENAKLTEIKVSGVGDLSGTYPVVSVTGPEIVLDISSNQSSWDGLGSTAHVITADDDATVGPANVIEAGFTDWVYITRSKSTRVLANVVALSGLYKDDGKKLTTATVNAQLQYQMVDEQRNPYGSIYTANGSVSGKSSDQKGVSIIANLPTEGYFRARIRRTTNKDLDFEGQVSDAIKYRDLYGQKRDLTLEYGNRTTAHTVRRKTAQATSIANPQFQVLTTELVYKYLGNGVFDTQLTTNTQAVQSLIRLLRDPEVGNLTLSTQCMDDLLEVQDEIETYFGSELAGQFCYTFDDKNTTTQQIINTVAEAIFCDSYREGRDIKLVFDRPMYGPEMVFTHRSKAPDSEKWTRTFRDRTLYDSLSYSYIDPETNSSVTIDIPETLGVKTESYESKGIRNYQQAYWHAWRRYLRNKHKKVSVQFDALGEGRKARPSRAISVVKGSRVAPYDGYVVAVNGLELTLSQEVEFTEGDYHSVLLKKRDGTVQSIGCIAGATKRKVVLLSTPEEEIYTGNSALKTEFSFGNDDRHAAQMMVASSVVPQNNGYVKIEAFNYSDEYYSKDQSTEGKAFDDGFDDGFS